MVRIRMQRLGRTHRPFFRICAIDQRTRRNGSVIENLGWYNPIEADPAKQIHIDADRVAHWLSQGAQPSESVEDMLGRLDLLPPKRKAAWEARRKETRIAKGAQNALKRVQAAAAEFTKFAAKAGADLSSQKAAIADAHKAAKSAVASGDPEAGERAAASAEAAWASAQEAEAAHKAAPKAAEG